jgi:type VI secretion system protein ImpC
LSLVNRHNASQPPTYMPDPIRPGNISFDISFKKVGRPAPVDENAPLRIAVLGDFSGRPAGEGDGCHAIMVDCDNFESLCAHFGAGLQLPPCASGTPEIGIHFASLDDFHPDYLLKTVPALVALQQLRARLLTPADGDGAASEVREMFKGRATAPPQEPLVTQRSENLISEAVAPSVIPAPGADQPQLLTMLDAEISARLRSVLHQPSFQALEATWRGLDFLVREAGDNVKLHAIDISREELDRQLASPNDPAATAIGRQLEQLTPTVILGSFSFGAEDADALLRIARLAGACGTAFIGGAKPELVGCASFATQPNPIDWARSAGAKANAFAEFRRAPESSRIGLALPRFLIRQPYGKESDPIQTLPFEELSTGDSHESYLWANPAFLCGHLMLNSFASDGWDMELGGSGGEIGGLPVHSFRDGSEMQTKPCAEAWLSEKAAEVILSHSIMPALSVRGRDSVLLVSLRSISEPARPLAFRIG